MDSQQPYGKEDLMKIIEEHLKETDKSQKYDQQLNKSSEKIFEIMENLNIWELKYRIRDHVKGLKELFNEIYEYVKEKTDISEIKKSNTVAYLYCKKFSNELILCENDIIMYLYEDKEFLCLLDTQQSPYHIKCPHHDDKRLRYSHQITSFIDSIKEKILDIHKILYPKLPEYHTRTDISMDLDKPKKAIPELSINGNSVIYDEGIFYMKVTLQRGVL